MDSYRKQGLQKFFSLDSVLFFALVSLLVLIPSFFLTSSYISFPFAKSILLTVGVTFTFVIFLIGIIKDGRLTFIKSPIFVGLIALVLAYVLSAYFGGSFVKSFIGYGFQMTTLGSIVLMAILAFVIAHTFTDSKKIFSGYIAFLITTTVLAVFHISRFVLGPDFLSLGIFGTPTSNTIGSWTEVGIFFGIGIVLSTIGLETLRLNSVYRAFLWLVLALSFFMVFIINFALVWYLLGTIIILFFIYYSASPALFASRMAVVSPEGSQDGTRLESPRRRIAFKSLIVAIAIIVCLLPATRNFSQDISVKFGIDSVEVRPSLDSTQEILLKSLKASPILGAGPNQFGKQWQLFRPDINLGNFWNTPFTAGFGYVLTSFVETGIIGILAWLGFFISILYVGFRGLFARGVDMGMRYIFVSSFAVTVFMWSICTLYVPSAPLISLAFIFTGFFITASVATGVTSLKVFPFMKYNKLSFVTVMVLVFVLIASIVLGYTLFESQRSSIYFQKGLASINSGQDVVAGENYLLEAANISKNDVYFQNLAELHILKIRALMAQVEEKSDATEAEKIDFQTILGRAIQFGLLAQETDPTNFQNHVTAARVYETIVPVKIEGVYQSSFEAYQRAIALSPKNPALYLDLARLEILNTNLDGAEDYILKSLELKPNFIDAIFLQSQIDVARGNIPLAVKSVEKILSLSPSDPLGYFRLGILKYEIKDYVGAIQALEGSVSRAPAYANARYFLGLSQSALGKKSEALGQFREIQKTNPDNAELAAIILNLEAGRNPFDDGRSVNTSTNTEAESVGVIEELPLEETY